MAAKFTRGDSMRTTHVLTAKNPPREAHATTRGQSPRKGNSIGMPGFIETGGDKSFAAVKGGRGVGPMREQDIGRRGSSGARSLAKARDSMGMSTGNYKRESTGRPGRIEEGDLTPAHRNTASRGDSAKGDGAPPASRGRIPGGGRNAGMGNRPEGGARGGTMESLRGRAKAFGERGGRRSRMY